jgi:hypothetical protein
MEQDTESRWPQQMFQTLDRAGPREPRVDFSICRSTLGNPREAKRELE